MIATPQKFRRPAHTGVDSIEGRVVVSTVHVGNKEFETMAFEALPNGRPNTRAVLFEERVRGEGAADRMHCDTCQRFDEDGAGYEFVSIGNYRRVSYN